MYVTDRRRSASGIRFETYYFSFGVTSHPISCQAKVLIIAGICEIDGFRTSNILIWPGCINLNQGVHRKRTEESLDSGKYAEVRKPNALSNGTPPFRVAKAAG